MSFRGGRGGFRGGRGRGGFRGGGGGRGRGGSFRGGDGGHHYGVPDRIIEAGEVLHDCESQLVVRGTLQQIVPYFNGRVFLANKEEIGRVDEILGPINDMLFSVRLNEGIKASSVKPKTTFYIDAAQTLPLSRFLPKPAVAKSTTKGKGGGTSGSRGGRGGPRGRGGFAQRGGGRGFSRGSGASFSRSGGPSFSRGGAPSLTRGGGGRGSRGGLGYSR